MWGLGAWRYFTQLHWSQSPKLNSKSMLLHNRLTSVFFKTYGVENCWLCFIFHCFKLWTLIMLFGKSKDVSPSAQLAIHVCPKLVYRPNGLMCRVTVQSFEEEFRGTVYTSVPHIRGVYSMSKSPFPNCGHGRHWFSSYLFLNLVRFPHGSGTISLRPAGWLMSQKTIQAQCRG